jgi:hypothetical protein
VKRLLGFLLLLGIVFAGWIVLSPADPVSLAKIKCEAAVERFTSYDVGLSDVTRAGVQGDVYTGIVTMPFDAGGKQRVAMCRFEFGETRSVTLDGKLLAGKL